MQILTKTLQEVEKIAKTEKFQFRITRFDEFLSKKTLLEVSDLDILVKNKDFDKVVSAFKKNGYISFSHDQALGGRVKGAQINLVKKDRIKIDLHKDFTWRAKKYLDLDLIWNKKELADQFLVFINIIFEKTYMDKEDSNYIWKHKEKIFSSKEFRKQAVNYKWQRTFDYFNSWQPSIDKFPVFLPLHIVLMSYLEKFNLTSFMYYIFFRSRYLLTKTLPYD